MKYQIYLNKQVSEVIELYAEMTGKKPNTLIKEYVENCFKIAMETSERTLEELQGNGKAKRKV